MRADEPVLKLDKCNTLDLAPGLDCLGPFYMTMTLTCSLIKKIY